MKQRFLSIFLVLALIIPFFPQVTLPAKAAETTAKTQDENSNDRDHKEGSIGSITDGTRTGKKEEGNKNGFTIMDTAPVDAKGEGQKRYVAVLGYWLGGKRLELYIADKDGNRVSNTYAIGGEKTLDYLEQADAFEDTGFVSVAAGDFNGDGKDTVIAYAPLMESDSEQPQLWKFSITAYGNNMQLDKTGTVCNIFDILGTGNIATKHSNNGKVFRNTPVVQMTTADTDKDSVDELVVTAGMNNTKADVNNRQSRMFIYDNITEEEKGFYWNKTFGLDTKGYNNGNQRLRWASSSVGNLVMTGSGADYPEIITAGWVDKKTNDGADLTHDIGAYVTSCSKTTKKGNSAIGAYGKSEVPAIGSNGQPQVSGFTEDGHYRDDVQSLVVVDTFAADGMNAKASVLIMDTVYTYEAGKGLNQEYRTDYFNHSDNGIGDSIITNGLVQDAVSGNFSGNEEGKEQIVFTTCQKRASRNQYFYKTYTYKKTGKSSWNCDSTGYRISKKGNAYTSLCAPDIDSDSTIARIKDVSLTYTEPEVLALLESTPYFSEVDEEDIGNSETAYGKENGEGDSVSTAEGLTTNIVAGFEWSVDDICAGFVCGAGFETSVEQGYAWETATSTTKKFSLNYSNDTGENQVILYRRPVTTYRYEIKGTKDTMVLARQGTLLTSMLPVDEYNEAAQSYELEEIADGTLATPGNPFSYRSSTAGLNNVAESKITTQYGKEGTVTQEFSTETEQEKTFTYDLNASFTAYGLVFRVKAGGGAGTTYSESQSTINTEAITKTGAVTGKQVEGYDFNWKFAHWTTKVNGTEIPVLGYGLTNVIAPPSPPENLAVESVTSDSAKITWDAGERGADEYRIYQIYSDGSDIQIGTVDGTESAYEVTGLKPDTSYTYEIKAYKEGKKGDAISGESVFSEKLIVTTLPEKMGTVTITNPEDTSVKIGGSAVFKAGLSSTASDYRATNYKWQRREKGGKWQTIDGANGKIVSAVAGKVDQIANIESGFVLASGATVDITAQPDTGYKVSCCKVNGKAVDGENGDTFTVPSGAKETPEVASYKVEAVCEKDQFTLTYAQPSNGTLTAKGAAGEVASGDKVNGDEKYTFTVKPDADYIVESWKVDGQVIDSHSASYEVTVKKDTEVSVQLVPASYKVTYKVNNEQGKLLVGKDTEEKTDGEISAAYGTSIKFTAVSNKFCHIKGWKLDGTEVTDTTEERRLPIQIRSVRRERYTDIL
ncbi:fibronectin type III domain-containing protein [Anaerobutyricum hallii]|uniref:fibronectin type III domain-containing protein n=1 Tax=Anaerobutyricum hallii TaxID=39488 RepID=UPI00399CA076